MVNPRNLTSLNKQNFQTENFEPETIPKFELDLSSIDFFQTTITHQSQNFGNSTAKATNDSRHSKTSS